MRRRFGQALRVGVSAHSLALAKTSRWGAPFEVVAEATVDGAGEGCADAIGAVLRRLLSESGCARWPASIVLADDFARIWQVAPALGSARMADLEGAAALRFQTLYGESAGAWQVSAAWDTSSPFLAAAVRRPLLAALHQAAAGEHVALLEIVPQFVAGWNRWCGAVRPGAWYGLVQHGVLTLGAVEAGSVRAVRSAPLPDGASVEWLAHHVAREALRLNLAAPARLMLSGRVPAGWDGGHGALACTVLGSGKGGALSAAALLAATGITL